jgi:hypothetical protein
LTIPIKFLFMRDGTRQPTRATSGCALRNLAVTLLREDGGLWDAERFCEPNNLEPNGFNGWIATYTRSSTRLRNEAGGKLSFIARLMAGTKNPQLDIFAFTQTMRGWGQDFGIAKRGDSER